MVSFSGDPKIKLTSFMTEWDEEHPDTQTDFPSGEAVGYQLFNRILGDKEGLDLPYFKNKANDITQIMQSFKRGSRTEARDMMLQNIELIRMMAGVGKDEEKK